MLLMMSALLSGLLGLVRIKYVNFLFGAGIAQDAYRAAFKWPDLLAYFLVGSAASVSMITMLNRYREQGDEEGADRALSVVLSTMLMVLTIVMAAAAIAAPIFVRIAYGPEFLHDARGPLCISLTRWLLPAQLFFFIGSMMSARLQVRKIFIYQALTPVIYNGGIVAGAFFLHNVAVFGKPLGVYSLVIGVLAGVIVGSALLNTLGALRTGLHVTPRIAFHDPHQQCQGPLQRALQCDWPRSRHRVSSILCIAVPTQTCPRFFIYRRPLRLTPVQHWPAALRLDARYCSVAHGLAARRKISWGRCA
jgi:putative peptidoglycan lipid II flippase